MDVWLVVGVVIISYVLHFGITVDVSVLGAHVYIFIPSVLMSAKLYCFLFTRFLLKFEDYWNLCTVTHLLEELYQ